MKRRTVRRKATAPRASGKSRRRRQQQQLKPIALTVTAAGDERVLALDTSSRCVGWAVFHNGELTQHGRYLQQGAGHGERMASFRVWILEMCAEFKPTRLIYEAPYRGRNGTTFGLLSKYAGVVEAAHFEHFGHEMPIDDAVPAKEVKRAIGAPKVKPPKRTPRGRKRPKVDVHEENKRLVTRMVNEHFGLALKYKEHDTSKKTSQDDEADAIALGWAWLLIRAAALEAAQVAECLLSEEEPDE